LQDVWLIVEFARRTRFEHVDDILVDIHDDEGYSLFTTLETPRVFEQIIDDYNDLYERYPPDVRHRALSHTYRIRGHAFLNQRVWSPDAPLAFWRAYRYDPDSDLRTLRTAFVSLFGRYGQDIAQWVSN
jgi:hypothetical protein